MTDGRQEDGIETDPELRRREVADFRTTGAVDLVERVMKALADEDWRVRKEASQVASQLAPNTELLVALVDTLVSGSNVGLRNAAVESLGSYGIDAVKAIDKVRDQLDSDGRKLAAEALARTGERAAVRILGDMAQDDDQNVVAAALESLSTVGVVSTGEAASILVKALGNEDAFLRLVTLNSINLLGLRIPWDSRLESFLSDPMLDTAAMVAAARGGDLAVGKHLAHAVEFWHRSKRASALSALGDYLAVGEQCADSAKAAFVSVAEECRELLRGLSQDSDAPLEERRAALRALGVLGGGEDAKVAVEALGSVELAEDAEAALHQIGAMAVGTLVANAREGGVEIRSACVRLLGAIADDSNRAEALIAINEAIADREPGMARSWLAAEALVGDEESLEQSVPWLRGDVAAQVRHSAEVAVSACATRYPVAARKMANQASCDGPDAAFAAVVIAALTVSGHGVAPRDVEFLTATVSNERTHCRRAALKALRTMPGAAATRAVAFALTDEAREVQLAAIRTLGQMKGAGGESLGLEYLFDLVSSGTDEALVTSAIHALGTVKALRARELLEGLAREARPARAVAAVEAMALDGKLAGVIIGLSHQEPEVVKATLQVLVAYEDPRVPTHLGACLDHAAWDVRRLAADLLARHGGDDAKRLLRGHLSTEKEALVREALSSALAEIEGRNHPSMPPSNPGEGS